MGDTVYRQEAVNALRAMQTYKLFEGGDMLLIDQAEAMKEMIALPSAQTKGKWEVMRNEYRGESTMRCSACLSDSGVLYEYQYCPNCGARMDGEQNDLPI